MIIECRYLLTYLLNIPSKFFGANRPFTTSLCCPSRDPLVPISASKKVMTCSGCLCILKKNKYTQDNQYQVSFSFAGYKSVEELTRLQRKGQHSINWPHSCLRHYILSYITKETSFTLPHAATLHPKGRQKVSFKEFKGEKKSKNSEKLRAWDNLDISKR